MGIPASYNFENLFSSGSSPSTVHTKNTALAGYFRKYLYQKATSVFAWDMPSEWPKNYFFAGLYMRGYISVIKTDRFGVIPQWCTLRGMDVFYQPTNAVIANHLLSGITSPRIGKECCLIKLTPDYGGIWDIISYYADLMALASEAVTCDLVNSKFAFAFATASKSGAETFKKMLDSVIEGNPAVVYDKSLLDENGNQMWQTFVQNLKENYIATDVLSDLRKIEAMFDTDIGIPNANTDKRERVITDEVNANNVETASKCELWLEEINKGCKSVKNMFGVEISAKWRVDPVKNGGVYGGAGSNAFNSGAV